MDDARRSSRMPGRRRAALAVVVLLAACSGGQAPQDVVAQAAVAVRDGHYEEALGLLDRLDQQRDVPLTVVTVAQDQRLIAVAGLRRRDELVAMSRELADVRGGLELSLGARTALAWLDAGGSLDELEPVFTQVERNNPYDGPRLRKALVARAEAPDGAAAVECLFCKKPGCDMDCVRHATCEFCPAGLRP